MLHIRIPEPLHHELTGAARSQMMSVSALVRIIIQAFLRERYREENR